MVELIEAKILDKLAPKEPVTLTFGNSLNEISYEKRYIFNFLLLKNQALDSGEFIVNDKTIYPNDNGDFSLFLLAVNSQNICLSCVFSSLSEDKDLLVKSVQEQLCLLRELPLINEEQKYFKIHKIFETLLNFNPAYILIDKGNDINKSSIQLINKAIFEYSYKMTIITLDANNNVDSSSNNAFSNLFNSKNKEETNYNSITNSNVDDEEDNNFDFIEVDGNDSTIRKAKQKAVRPINKKVKSKEPVNKYLPEEKEKKIIDFNYIAKLFKKEWTSFLFIIYGTLSTIFFVLIVPYQFSLENNALLSTVFLLGSILCFVVNFLIISSLFSFMDKIPYSKKRTNYSLTFTLISIVLGALLAVGLLFLLKSKDILVVNENYQNVFLIPGIIISIIILIIPFFMYPIRQLSVKLKALFPSKKEEGEK